VGLYTNIPHKEGMLSTKKESRFAYLSFRAFNLSPYVQLVEFNGEIYQEDISAAMGT
jgi:hypothetical protein